jgi:N-acetylglucosamine-6-sulfatase
MPRRLSFHVVLAALALAGAGCESERVGAPIVAPVLSRVVVSPELDTLTALGDTVRLTATAFDTLDRPVPGVVIHWQSLAPELVVVDDSGRAVATAGNGSAQIVGSAGGRADTALVVVVQQPVGVRITPATDTLRAGHAAALSAVLVDANGRPIADAPIAWASGDSGVAVVDSTGIVQALAPGTVTIRATVAGLTDSVQLVILPPGNAPDIFIILGNDLRPDRLDPLASTMALLEPGGVRFSLAFAPAPLGSPSRATFLTGLLPQTHGVRTDFGPQGGAAAFEGVANLATWLKAKGYRTAYVGEYLEEPGRLRQSVPPEWDEWIVLWRGLRGSARYFNYSLNENGTFQQLGKDPAVYSTTLLADFAVQVVRRAPGRRPLFLVFAPFAPRFPSTPAPGDEDAFTGRAPPPGPAFQEPDVTDKPFWVRQRPILTPREVAIEMEVQEDYLESLLEVDRGVRRIAATLEAAGRLDEAVVVLASDQGVHLGEHRLWQLSSASPYDEAIQVPLWIRAPGLIEGTDTALASLADLAPTLLELAGVPAPRRFDGTSLVPRLRRQGAPEREGLLIEHQGEDAFTPPERQFVAVRTPDALYAEYQNGEREFYDLRRDPNQLENRAADPTQAARVRQLARLLARLAGP